MWIRRGRISTYISPFGLLSFAYRSARCETLGPVVAEDRMEPFEHCAKALVARCDTVLLAADLLPASRNLHWPVVLLCRAFRFTIESTVRGRVAIAAICTSVASYSNSALSVELPLRVLDRCYALGRAE